MSEIAAVPLHDFAHVECVAGNLQILGTREKVLRVDYQLLPERLREIGSVEQPGASDRGTDDREVNPGFIHLSQHFVLDVFQRKFPVASV